MLCAAHHDVRLWSRDPTIAEGIRRTRRNPRYLDDVELPAAVEATTDLPHTLEGRELVICAVPSHGVRDVMRRAAPHFDAGAILVSTVKGIEVESCLRMDEVMRQELPHALHRRLVFLSGPSFAREIANRRPTAVTVACEDEAFAISVQESISCPWFRCYSATDVVGVELAGALKNVIAIAVGVCDGLGLGQNSRAALMTRGLREITRLGVKLGADPLTFLGLAGMGDLILTCTGDLSRNRRVGLELARGRSRDEIVAGMSEVAEGIRTAYAACALAAQHGVEMPISHLVRGLVAGDIGVRDAMEQMLSRQLRAENE
jgi:glycerol-3-phosphate dehydrogenase (NAD(P)+)